VREAPGVGKSARGDSGLLLRGNWQASRGRDRERWSLSAVDEGPDLLRVPRDRRRLRAGVRPGSDLHAHGARGTTSARRPRVETGLGRPARIDDTLGEPARVVALS